MASATVASRSIYFTEMRLHADAAPKLPVALHEVAAAPRSRNAQLAHARLRDPTLRAARTPPADNDVTGMKSIMDLVGLAEGRVLPPLSDLRPDEVDDVLRSVESGKLFS